ncbi:MAG: cell division protein DedD [Sodalis sp. (in: enterobacteria)]
MVNKFKKRLIGTTILVALSVVILCSLLDDKKKNYKNNLPVSLATRPGENELPDTPSSISQRLPNHLLGNSEEAVEESDWTTNSGQAKFHLPYADNRDSSQLARKDDLLVEVNPEYKGLVGPESKLVIKSQIPKGQAWVVQLGALKNVDKVFEIVTKLRLSGYHVYTSPPVPVPGQITRIFVGPDVSKKKLQSALEELSRLSGLDGQVRLYSVN